MFDWLFSVEKLFAKHDKANVDKGGNTLLENKMSAEKVKKKVAIAPPISDTKLSIEWQNKSSSLAQVYSSGLEYCFISSDNKQCCPFVYCKDFLQDYIMGFYHKTPVSIYGFSYDPSVNVPVDLERTKICLANSADNNFLEKIPAVVDFIRQFERALKLIRTTAYQVENPPKKYKSGAVVLESSNRWMLAPPMLSMYSLLLRVGFTHKVGDDYKVTVDNLISGQTKPYQNSDVSQLKGAKNGIESILKSGYASVFYKDVVANYPKIDTNNMHHSMGIVAYSNKASCQPQHWHRKIAKKTKKKTETPATEAKA